MLEAIPLLNNEFRQKTGTKTFDSLCDMRKAARVRAAIKTL